MPAVPVLAAYQTVDQLANDSTFLARVRVALAVEGVAIIAATATAADPRYDTALAQCINPSAGAVQRCAYRILVAGLTSASLDSDIQNAVHVLIPAAGTFQL